MPAEKARALVLRTTDWSETSRIATKNATNGLNPNNNPKPISALAPLIYMLLPQRLLENPNTL